MCRTCPLVPLCPGTLVPLGPGPCSQSPLSGHQHPRFLASLLWHQKPSVPYLHLLQGDTSSDYLIHTKVLKLLMT